MKADDIYSTQQNLSQEYIDELVEKNMIPEKWTEIREKIARAGFTQLTVEPLAIAEMISIHDITIGFFK